MSKKKNKDKYKGASLRFGTGIHNSEARKALERYGIDKRNYTSSGAIAQGRVHGKGTYEDMEKDLLRAAQSDYHTNRAIEAAAMSGDKDFKKFAKNGIENFGDLLEVQDLQRKAHKDFGNGGNFSSASDFAGLSYKFAQQDRENQTAGYDEKYATKSALEELTENFKASAPGAEATEEEIVRSDRLQNAYSRLEDAAESSGMPTLFGNENEAPARVNDQQQAATNFLEDYKKDVVRGADLKHDIQEGLSNASRRVRDIYNR